MKLTSPSQVKALLNELEFKPSKTLGQNFLIDENILKLVMKQSLQLAAIGVGIGLVAAFALSRLIQSLLFGVGALDPITFLGTPLLLAAVALVASYIPALRATRVDPITALRYE